MTQFDAVWEVIKGWDIQRKPDEGYAHATGSDVDAILKAFWEADTALTDLQPSDRNATTDAANAPTHTAPTSVNRKHDFSGDFLGRVTCINCGAVQGKAQGELSCPYPSSVNVNREEE